MITLQTTTGLLIAAMLNVLGTSQHEVTKVGNEPVVKEERKSFDKPEVRQAQWFIYTNLSPANSTTAMQPTNYELHDEILHGPLCNENTEFCAVLTPPQGGTPTRPDLSGTSLESQDAVDAINDFFENDDYDDSLIKLKN